MELKIHFDFSTIFFRRFNCKLPYSTISYFSVLIRTYPYFCLQIRTYPNNCRHFRLNAFFFFRFVMPPKKATKGKPKGRPASPIAGPSKKSRKVAASASFLDSDSDEFTDDAKSVAMSDVRSDPIERPEPVAAVDTVIPDEDEDAPLARTTKRSTLRPSTAQASAAAAAVVPDDDDVDDPQPQPQPDSDDESSVVVDPRGIEPTPSTSR